MTLCRVFPWLPEAATAESGHPLSVPVPQGAGRLDNPELYRVLYVSDSPVGAVAERFGNLAVWSDAMFISPRDGGRMSLATYELAEGQVLDLDDAQTLLDRDIRPSQVVTRHRATTRQWALRIFEERRWAGVRWWSYYDPDWGSLGLWEQEHLSVLDVVPLDRQHLSVVQAAGVIKRTWV
ncbi:MAG TPA: RES domain-containing protein [Actinomycetota bacterium]|nr:RES domain-containing protein [Actinomycetota bacterium]